MPVRVLLGLGIWVVGVASVVLPIANMNDVCTTHGTEQICATFPVPGGADLTSGPPDDGSLTYLLYWLIGPCLVLIGAGLLFTGHRTRVVAGPLLIAAGLVSVAMAPSAQSCMAASDFSACDTTGSILLNVSGVVLMAVGAGAFLALVAKLLGSRQVHKIAA